MNNSNTIKYAVGIDVGGSSLKCGLMDQDGQLLYSSLVSLRDAKTEGAIVSSIADAIKDCASKVATIIGVGIGFPGVIYQNVVIGGADNLPGFVNFPLGDVLTEITGHQNLKIDNDANLMGLGEQTYGAAKNASDVNFLTVGTGIGGSILIDNKLHGGFRNRGGEIGHLVIKQGGKKCACGGKGCLEAYASVTELIHYYKQIAHTTAYIDGKYIVDRYLAGDGLAMDAMTRHFDYLSSGIVGLVNIFSPQKVVIGGGISEAGSFYLEEITRRVVSASIPVCVADTSFVTAKLGNNAGVLGCGALVFQDV